MSDKKFTLYWLDGKRQVITGETIEQAYTQAGYGAGAIKAVDFYFDGDNHEYAWNTKTKSWDRIVPLPIAQLIDPTVTVTAKPTADEQAKLAQGYSWNVEMNIKPVEEPTGKFKFFLSHNLGASYVCEYSTDNKDDPELARRIQIAQRDMLRYYVEGDDSIVSPQHKAIVDFLGGSHQQRTIEEQAAMLRSKFGK